MKHLLKKEDIPELPFYAIYKGDIPGAFEYQENSDEVLLIDHIRGDLYDLENRTNYKNALFQGVREDGSNFGFFWWRFAIMESFDHEPFDQSSTVSTLKKVYI